MAQGCPPCGTGGGDEKKTRYKEVDFGRFEAENKKRYLIFENEAEKLLKTKGKTTYVSRNEPENEPEKSFRIALGEKRTRNEPENELEKSFRIRS
ncbi:MAG TPA: hypothetical protein VJW77_16240 [Terriglobia bacterium]|nr:hypothetical protein [Terriglobia bacterium]